MPSPSLVLLRTQSDARLVALAREGHERAFEAIVERYRRQLLRACRRVLPEARAEDALQQALVAAWRGLQRGDEVRELRPWLHRIAHNASLNLLREAGYDYVELQESLRIADAPDDELERRAVVRQTLHGLASLPPRQREALLAIAVEGRSQDEVAGDFGLSPGAVRQLVHRARTALRTAATAVVPLPLVTWVASGGAGAGAVLAKAGTVAVLAGGAVAGPALIEKRTSGPQVPAAAQAAAPRGDRQARPPSLRAGAPRTAPVAAIAVTQRTTSHTGSSRRVAATTPSGERDGSGEGDDRSGRDGPGGSGPDRSGREDDDSHSGPSGGGDDDRSGPSGDDADDRSGPSGGDDAAGSEIEDRSGSSRRSGTSGRDGGDDREQLAAPAPSATPEPTDEPEPDNSGPGSGGDD
ncbi:MAG TPA: sigma-70 family RNA polymerase sigma factor [Solirubrobacteraceae bacterium]|nr:sigma-70 family RNA polymerase sigma factor [Solirubrobacteraceae bacterium]